MERFGDYVKKSVLSFKLDNCCFVASVRTGALTLACGNVILGLIILVNLAENDDDSFMPLMLQAFKKLTDKELDEAPNFVPTCIIGYAAEIASNALVICAMWRNDLVLLRAYLYYALGVLTVAIMVYSVVFGTLTIWPELFIVASLGINLQASAMTSDSDSLVGYSVYGACAAELELDVLTGNHVIARVDLLEDTGVSLSPDIDVGQIEGAFIMGLGLWTSEELKYDRSGRLLTDRTWTYKPPGVRDIPADFRVSFKRNSVNNAGVLRSKATGEPALTLAVAVTHALRDAIAQARKEYGYKDAWIDVDTPFNVENILKAISPKPEFFKLK